MQCLEKRPSEAGRLLAACERWDIKVSVTHTPGEKLDRPDQTSRGDPVEEPRARVRRRVFEQLEAEFGAFTETIGAEREFAKGPEHGQHCS